MEAASAERSAVRGSATWRYETSFQIDNTSSAYYTSVYYTRHKDDLQPVPPPKVPQPRIDLREVLGADFLAPSIAAKRVTFHAVGDTGAAKVNAHQSAAQSIANEAKVADAMSGDVRAGGPLGPLFFHLVFFHLGDVIYNFGEGQYYYDQFYEPFRNYDRPIFAIPETTTAWSSATHPTSPTPRP